MITKAVGLGMASRHERGLASSEDLLGLGSVAEIGRQFGAGNHFHCLTCRNKLASLDDVGAVVSLTDVQLAPLDQYHSGVICAGYANAPDLEERITEIMISIMGGPHVARTINQASVHEAQGVA